MTYLNTGALRTGVTVCAILAAAVIGACNTETVNGQEDAQSVDTTGSANEVADVMPTTETGKRLLQQSQQAAAVAIAKAEELGYELDTMLMVVRLTPEGGWHVAFNPNSTVQSGGDLTVDVDVNGEITDVKRWR